MVAVLVVSVHETRGEEAQLREETRIAMARGDHKQGFHLGIWVGNGWSGLGNLAMQVKWARTSSLICTSIT